MSLTHRPGGDSPGSARTRRTPLHLHGSDPAGAWPPWTDEIAIADSLPPDESAVLSAIEHMARPVTAGELLYYNSAVARLKKGGRDIALAGLLGRGLIESRVTCQPSTGCRERPYRVRVYSIPGPSEDRDDAE